MNWRKVPMVKILIMYLLLLVTPQNAVFIHAASDTNSFIAFSRNVKYVTETDDGISAYTTTPTAWALANNIPVFRIRHPLNVTSNPNLNSGIGRDFMILPYQFGTAIEYNGVVECWVGEWSIHKGLYYYDVEGKGNGWGGVLWIGDDQDRGGVRVTARDNSHLGGNVNYGELSVEKFHGLPNGDLRLRLPSTQNDFHFVYGEKGSTNIIAKMKNEGLVIPKISAVTASTAPERAQIVYDSTDNQFKGYNGAAWMTLSGNELITGTYTRSSTGSDLIYAVPHGLGVTPSYFNIIATSSDSANISYITADDLHIYVHYLVLPVAGTDNLSWNWQVKK